MACIFCQIAKKEIKSFLVYEDEAAIAILDINPRAPGHTMVLPKNHAEKLSALNDAALGPVFAAVKKTANLLQKSLAPDAFTIGINDGLAAGQVVEHLHIHIIPRYKNDGGASLHSVVNNPPKWSLEEIKKKIESI